jgi:hypothetical protein
MMQIVFDEKLAQEMKDRYTVLELDTVMHEGLTKPIVLHAVVDRIPIDEIPLTENHMELHQQLISYYKSGDWQSVQSLIPFLTGKWGGELDSFYENIAEFVRTNNVDGWTGIRNTVPSVDKDI